MKKKRRIPTIMIILLAPFLFLVMCAGAFLYCIGMTTETAAHNKERSKSRSDDDANVQADASSLCSEERCTDEQEKNEDKER